MLTEQQKQWRRAGIGGSDMPAIMGLSPWRTPMQVYLEKIGEAEEQPETKAQYWGSRHEKEIINTYSKKLLKEQFIIYSSENIQPFQHPSIKILLGNYDGLIADFEQHSKLLWGLECKTASYDDDWGIEGTDEIPQYYLPQVHHYLTIEQARSGITRWDVAVLIRGNDDRYYTVNYNEQISNRIIEVGTEFWDHVQRRIPPALTTVNDWQLKYNKLTETSIEASDYIITKLRRLHQLSSMSKKLEDESDIIKAEVMDYMQTNKSITAEGIKVGTIIKAEYPKWDNDALNKDAELVAKYKTGVTKKAYFNFSRSKELNKILGE